MQKISDIKIIIPETTEKPAYKCPKCRDSGFQFGNDEAWPCECQYAAIWKYRRKKAGISEKMARISFNDFALGYYADKIIDGKTQSDHAEKAFYACLELVSKCINKEKNIIGLILTGLPGRGKSMLATATANEVLKHGREVLFLSVPDFLDEIRETYNNANSDVTDTEIIEKAQKAKLLILDDLGAHKNSEWSVSVLFRIIDYRNRYNLPCIITTNIPTVKGLEKCIGIRGVSRLSEMCRVFLLDSPKDIRVMIAEDIVDFMGQE